MVPPKQDWGNMVSAARSGVNWALKWGKTGARDPAKGSLNPQLVSNAAISLFSRDPPTEVAGLVTGFAW